MKKLDLQKLREKPVAEIEAQLVELQAALTTAYLEKNARKLKSPATIKNLKTDIARVQTILNEK